MIWTEKKVKAKLPRVTVSTPEFDDPQAAYVYGRLRQQAIVILADRVACPFEVPWSEIAEALTVGKALELV